MESQAFDSTSEVSAKRPSLFNIHFILYALVFLVPLFVIPLATFPLQFSKVLLVLIGVGVLLVLLFIGMLRRAQAEFQWSPALLALWLLPLVYLIASFFSQAPLFSLFGYQLETDTFGFMLLGALVVTVITMIATRVRVLSALMAFLYAIWVVFAFQLIQVLFGAPLPIPAFSNPTVNLIGSWNDFMVFSALIASLALLTYISVPLQRVGRVLIAGTFLVALFFLALVNMTEMWILFGLVALALFVMVLAQYMQTHTMRLGALVFTLIGVVAAGSFIFFGDTISPALQNTFNISSLEVRPSFQGTLGVLQQAYSENPIVGSGPNTFSANWLLYRPDAVLQTIFWNTSFNAGSATILTSFVTGGVLVALGWIIFSLLLLYTAGRALFTVSGDGRSYVITSISALGAVFLLISHYVYTPSQSLTILFFIFVGLLLASVGGTSMVRSLTFNLSGAPRMRYAFIVAMVFVVLGAVTWVYSTGRTYASTLYHQQAIQIANAGDLDRSEELIQSAINLSSQDRYYRTAALINVAQLNRIVQSEEATQEAQAEFQQALASAIQNTTSALDFDQNRYENWLTHGIVYASVVPLQIDGAFDNAVAVLEEARLRSPSSPEIDFRLAEVYAANGDTVVAREFLTAAVEKKPDYTQAILFLAQIELNEGNLREATESVRAAVFFEPQNAVLLYQLGILLLQDEEYEQAAAAFELALGAQPDYANAAFFLAQSYAFLDRTDEASQLMGQLAVLNPDNELVVEYAADLARGINPFAPGEVAAPEEEEGVVE